MSGTKSNILIRKCKRCGEKYKTPNTGRGRKRSFCSHNCSSISNGLANKGRKRTEEYKAELSKKLTGAGNPFYGKKHSKKTIEAWSISKTGVAHHHPLHDIPIKDRILNSINISENGCWMWVGWFRLITKNGGYGGIKVKGVSYLAHRLSYEEFKGEIPKGMYVLHKCDTPECVNPDHLFLGTHDDNMKDMAKKNRGTSGEKSHKTPLTEKDVLKIRSLSGEMFHREIAKIYLISTTAVTSIINRKNWKHI